jgi:hypothetical protein
MSILRNSARDIECTVRIPGICLWTGEYSILSHFPGSAGGKGRGLKSDDVCGAICCTACDAVIDRQRKPPPGMTYEDCMLCWHEGHIRTLHHWRQNGRLLVAGERRK